MRINTEARPLALQVALSIPILAALVGLANSFRMVKLPEPESSRRQRGDVVRLNPPLRAAPPGAGWATGTATSLPP